MKTLQITFILLLFSQLCGAQNRTVSGVVKDSSGIPLPGLSILIEGTKTGTQADFEGNYSIKVNSDQFLIFSYIGMQSQRIMADKNEINVTLLESDEILKEGVFDPSLRNRKKESLINAVKTLSPREIKNDNNPKYQFKKNYKNGFLIIYFPETTNFKKRDLDFQSKYKLLYAVVGNPDIEYLKKYNKLTFKYLNKKYKNVWQSEVRKDAIGLNEFLE
jgi:hypothetical protein